MPMRQLFNNVGISVGRVVADKYRQLHHLMQNI
jgi:hypothetical protein